MRGWLTGILLLLAACGGGDFQKSPLDVLIRDLDGVAPFTVILHDMDVEGTFFKKYYHQYKVVAGQDSVQSRLTEFKEVSSEFFEQNEQNMGMEVASKSPDGKLTKAVAPPGYSQYVGNQQYGQWVNQGGSSFWQFYGQYAFMSAIFNTLAYPARRSYWNDYRGGYYGTGRPYYGPTSGGRSAYGTYSDYTRRARPNATFTRTNTFKDRVRSRTSRSRSGSSASRSRTSRSGSRYGGSGGYRSRGGGFGK